MYILACLYLRFRIILARNYVLINNTTATTTRIFQVPTKPFQPLKTLLEYFQWLPSKITYHDLTQA